MTSQGTSNCNCSEFGCNHRLVIDRTIDWYDGPILALATCQNCNQRFVTWLVAWEPGSSLRTNAAIEVDSQWASSLEELATNAGAHNLFDNMISKVNTLFDKSPPSK